MMTSATATVQKPAASKSRSALPTFLTSSAVSAGPTILPALLPAAMQPNRRLDCSLVCRSAIRLQNAEMMNRLTTLTQTKNSRAPSASHGPCVSRA